MAAKNQILRWKWPENVPISSLFLNNGVKVAAATWPLKVITPATSKFLMELYCDVKIWKNFIVLYVPLCSVNILVHFIYLSQETFRLNIIPYIKPGQVPSSWWTTKTEPSVDREASTEPSVDHEASTELSVDHRRVPPQWIPRENHLSGSQGKYRY